jgi:phospholipid/cholesterol/gamma-HCH transport system substrate-binding protein
MTGPGKVRRNVALFFLVTVGVLVGVVLLLGSSQGIFTRKVILHTKFANTSGLIKGASVRLAGVAIGIVHSIHFDPDPHAKRVDVDLSVNAQFLDRIRSDSVAQIESKGLLGDMIIDITVGSPDARPLQDGDHLESAEASGLTQVVDSVQSTVGKLDVLVTDVDGKLKELLTPQVDADMGKLIHSTAQVMDDVVRGKGLVHQVVYDPGLAKDANRTFEQIPLLVERINTSVDDIEKMIAEVRTGSGLLHGLVYEKTGTEALAQLDRAASDLSAVVKEIQTGRGIAHSMIYEEDKSNLIQNLSEAARIVRDLAERTQQGKGTLGGLLMDPTVYEDLTTVLGNLKRNELLKALIRYDVVTNGLNKSNGRAQPPANDAPSKSPKP